MGKLKDVNTKDIGSAVGMGCQTMCSVFNADDNDIPFFGSFVRPQAELKFSQVHSESHVPGRHLNALLNAEAALGVRLDEECIDKHRQAAFFSYSGAAPLPLNRDRIDGPLINFIPHNIREGFHALYPLVAYRNCARSLELAEQSIAAIFAHWDAVTGWDKGHLEGKLGLQCHDSTFITGLARTIGPLVKLYRSSGLKSALELALVLANKTLEEFFTEEGRYDRETFGTHTHSVTCVMSSLAQLADLKGDMQLLDRVRTFYDNGLWDIRDSLGWVIENAGDGSDPDRGEVNNTGDIVETALILGRWGYGQYYEDAERILRGHLLPAQLRDVSFIEEPANPAAEDGKRDMARRHQGAFGFPAPYGHAPLDGDSIKFNMDIVGGSVGSLCEVYRERVRSDQAGHWVNLFFDCQTPELAVESPYTHPALSIRVKKAGPLFVRLPSWVDAKTVQVRGTDEIPRLSNGYLFIAQPPLNRPLVFDFPLVEEEIVLQHRTREIRARLRGDEVVAMDNFGAELTFFDPLD